MPFLQVFFSFSFECDKIDDFYFTFFLRLMGVRDLFEIDGKTDIFVSRYWSEDLLLDGVAWRKFHSLDAFFATGQWTCPQKIEK